jgi:hypothetical protein
MDGYSIPFQWKIIFIRIAACIPIPITSPKANKLLKYVLVYRMLIKVLSYFQATSPNELSKVSFVILFYSKGLYLFIIVIATSRWPWFCFPLSVLFESIICGCAQFPSFIKESIVPRRRHTHCDSHTLSIVLSGVKRRSPFCFELQRWAFIGHIRKTANKSFA